MNGGQFLSVLQIIITILFVCLISGFVIMQLLFKKRLIQEPLKKKTIFLVGIVIAFAIILKAVITSIILFFVILGIDSFLGNHFFYETKMELYLFSLVTSMLAFLYMLCVVYLLKILASTFKLPRILRVTLESMLVFFAMYLSMDFLSNAGIVSLSLSSFGKIVISAILTLIYSGLGSIFDGLNQDRER